MKDALTKALVHGEGEDTSVDRIMALSLLPSEADAGRHDGSGHLPG